MATGKTTDPGMAAIVPQEAKKLKKGKYSAKRKK